MIKRILFFFLVIAGIVSCKDDDNIGFDVPVEFPSISFKPVPGGAVMHYVLPDRQLPHGHAPAGRLYGSPDGGAGAVELLQQRDAGIRPH